MVFFLSRVHYDTHPGNELAGSCYFDFFPIRARIIFLKFLHLSHIILLQGILFARKCVNEIHVYTCATCIECSLYVLCTVELSNDNSLFIESLFTLTILRCGGMNWNLNEHLVLNAYKHGVS